MYNDDNKNTLRNIAFLGTQRDWNQTLLDTIDKCFTELDNNNFKHRYIIANRKNCKLFETFDEFTLDYKEIVMTNERFMKIGFLRYLDIEVLFDRTARDDTLLCISKDDFTPGNVTKEIKIIE